MTKEELRKTMKALLTALPAGQFADEGERAARRLAGNGVWKDSRRVLLFCSMRGEISTRPLIERAFHDGKEMYFPKTESGIMRFYRIISPDGPWVAGAFGIREPADGSKLFRAEDAAPDVPLIVTPGLAFDRKGGRLGRGGGYYDKFFAALDASRAVYRAAAFCLACQIIREVPTESLDKKVNALCTAKEFLAFS
jgi:5-formyltetrahydrofolate cyclo-ligase